MVSRATLKIKRFDNVPKANIHEYNEKSLFRSPSVLLRFIKIKAIINLIRHNKLNIMFYDPRRIL